MTNEELYSIIEKFDENDLKSKAIFGIFQYGGGADESYIKANKEGLELFALELLKSAKETDTILADKEKNIIPLNWDENWIDDECDTIVQYIKPISDKQAQYPIEDYKQTIIDKLMPIGCGLIMIFLGITLLVGIGTIFNWVFNTTK